MADNQILKTGLQSILDEPIPETVKKRLLKPLIPKPIPPIRQRKLEKRKLLLQEYDPLYDKTKRIIGVKRRELLSLATNHQNLTKPPEYILLQEFGDGAVTGWPASRPPPRS